MAPFEAKYTQEQWDAIYDAKFARGLAYKRIAELAASGELTGEAFKITHVYIGERCRLERRRRRGKIDSNLAGMTTADSNEFMRRTMLNLWDSERLQIERQKPGNRDLARFEQLAKAAIVIARIPGPKDLAPRNPVTKDENGQRGPELRGGTTGQLLKALRGEGQAQSQPAPEIAPRRSDETEAASQDEAGRSGSLTHEAADAAA